MLSAKQKVLMKDIWWDAATKYDVIPRLMANTSRRKAPLFQARQEAIYNMSKAGFTTSQINEYLIEKYDQSIDHSTMVTAVRRHAETLGEDLGPRPLRRLQGLDEG